MDFIIENYGRALVIVGIVIAFVALMTFLLATDGTVAQQFQKLLADFFTKVAP